MLLRTPLSGGSAPVSIEMCDGSVSGTCAYALPKSVLPVVASYAFSKLYVPVVGETPGMNSTGVSVNGLKGAQVTRRTLPGTRRDWPNFVPHAELREVRIVVLITVFAPLVRFTT